MKKTIFIIVLLIITAGSYSQLRKEVYINVDKKEIHSRFENRKDQGYYYSMQVSLMMGNSQYTERNTYVYPYYGLASSLYAPTYSNPYIRTKMAVSPSVTISNGYMFNEHWAAGAGIGFEIFDHNLFPLFAELRYTLTDHKISPFVTLKGGYALGSFKAKQYDDLYLEWEPYYVNDAKLRHYGGLMLHPEIGVKVPINENNDLLFTAAYRYQKTKSEARKDYENGQFDEWEHKENLNRLSLGVAIMFR